MQPGPGAPKGNHNAIGNSGGAPSGNKNNYKHGIYSKIYWDTLDDQELQMISDIDCEEENLLIDQIKLLTVRERRLLKSIEENKNRKGSLSLQSVVKRTLHITGERRL